MLRVVSTGDLLDRVFDFRDTDSASGHVAGDVRDDRVADALGLGEHFCVLIRPEGADLLQDRREAAPTVGRLGRVIRADEERAQRVGIDEESGYRSGDATDG